jgi:hypothetical protein
MAVATSVQLYASPEAMNKEAADDWVDLIFGLWAERLESSCISRAV